MPIKSTQRTLRKCMRRLIRQKPMSQIGVEDICTMAEISRRTFYRYYPDKYALFTDTYIQEFYNKLDFTNITSIYDIYLQMVEQMYEDRDFFTHAIQVKDQNGFWEMIVDLLLPISNANLTSDPEINADKEFFIKKDIEVVLYFMERWIRAGFNKTPQEFVDYIILCNAVHGKWEYQIATGRKTDEYTADKIKNKEW